VKRSLRGWVEAVLTQAGEPELGGEQEFQLAEITILSDEEVDELVPPRTGRWPASALSILREKAGSAEESMRRRRRFSDYDLGD